MATYEHNAEPLATLRFQLDGGVSPFELRQIVGNVLLLLPFGIYGPILTPRLRPLLLIIVAGAALSTLIELGQLAVSTAYGFPVRVADVDDVLLNTAGVVIGWVGWRVAAVGAKADAGRAGRIGAA